MAKVLIVEDDPTILNMYKMIFVHQGHEVEMAIDGADGLAKVPTFKPAVVLLDIMMPKMNGIEVLEKLKADPATKDIPVVMLTNLGGDQDVSSAMSKGAVKYIVKSEHEPHEVVDMVERVLDDQAA